MLKKSFCNTAVKEAFTFYLPVTYEIFISGIVLLVIRKTLNERDNIKLSIIYR